jgi:hypothetical protein
MKRLMLPAWGPKSVARLVVVLLAVEALLGLLRLPISERVAYSYVAATSAESTPSPMPTDPYGLTAPVNAPTAKATPFDVNAIGASESPAFELWWRTFDAIKLVLAVAMILIGAAILYTLTSLVPR